MATDMERYRTDPEFRARKQKQNREAKARARKDPEKLARIRKQSREVKARYSEVNGMRDRCQKCSYRKWWFDVRDVLGFDKCCACGSSENIQCHHVDDSEKSFAPSEMCNNCPSAERLQLYIDELKKCIPLCQHCHMDLHAISSNKRQARVYAGITRFILENL